MRSVSSDSALSIRIGSPPAALSHRAADDPSSPGIMTSRMTRSNRPDFSCTSISAAWDAFQKGQSGAFDPLVFGHVAGGVLILAFVVWRLALRRRRSTSPPPHDEHPALKVAAKLAHWAFYAVLIGLSLTGLLARFGAIAPAAGVHDVLKTDMLALIVLHVLAALFQQFVLKTGVMGRMTRSAA